MLIKIKEGELLQPASIAAVPKVSPLESGRFSDFPSKTQKRQGVIAHVSSSASSGCFQPSR